MKNIIEYFKIKLGIDLTNLKHPISAKINSIPSSSETTQKIKEHHLRILGLSLMEIKDYDNRIYDYYLKRIVNNSDISIHGHIFEINQCAHFIKVSVKEKLTFKFGDANSKEPDFIINGFGMEITSSRFSENSNMNNPGRKLLNKFREKNDKPYAQSNCVLIIDINQMTYHTIKKGKPVSPTFDEVRELIKSETNFGLVLTFVEWIDNRDGNFHFAGTVYSTYNNDCDPELKKLMEQKFIISKQKYEGEIMISPN